MTSCINTKMCFRFASAGSSSSAKRHQKRLSRSEAGPGCLNPSRSCSRPAAQWPERAWHPVARPTHNHRFGIWCGKMNIVLLLLRNRFIYMWWIWIVWSVMTGNGLQERTHQDIRWSTGVKIRCNTFVHFSSLQFPFSCSQTFDVFGIYICSSVFSILSSTISDWIIKASK